MKTKLASHRSSAGYALLMVMSAAACLLLVMGSTMLRTSTNALINDHNRVYTTGLYAAEAAVEKVIARMRNDYANGIAISNNLSIYRGLVPTTAEDPYWGNFRFSDSQGNANAPMSSACPMRITPSSPAPTPTSMAGYRVPGPLQRDPARLRLP